MASSGIGSPPHIFGALFEMMAGVDLFHVPYVGNYLPDLLTGQVQIAFAPVQAPIGYFQSEKLLPLAVTTSTRVQALPSVPTVGEFVPAYEATGWIGIGAPKGTPTAVIEQLHNEINLVIHDNAFADRLRALGNVPLSTTPSEFGKFIAVETEKWAKVIKFRDIKVD